MVQVVAETKLFLQVPQLMKTFNNISGTPEEQGRQILSLFFPQSRLHKYPNYIDYFPLLQSTVSAETAQK